jgi:UDP-glucose 6-dehydrogenase
VSDGMVIVAGMGEVGKPLFRILSRAHKCVAVDVEPVEVRGSCAVLHICYPFQLPDFVGTTLQYIGKYQPGLTIIHSTVAPGTTRRVQSLAGNRAVLFSPVRGKHARMETDMLRYKKYVAGFDAKAVDLACHHLGQAGFRTAVFRNPETAELSKLLETTYFGVLIAWAQEVERFAQSYQASFEELNAFVEEIDFLPSHIFPGLIGGHCVMPNIAILQRHFDSQFLEAIVQSNQAKEDALKLEQEQKLSA